MSSECNLSDVILWSVQLRSIINMMLLQYVSHASYHWLYTSYISSWNSTGIYVWVYSHYLGHSKIGGFIFGPFCIHLKLQLDPLTSQQSPYLYIILTLLTSLLLIHFLYLLDTRHILKERGDIIMLWWTVSKSISKHICHIQLLIADISIQQLSKKCSIMLIQSLSIKCFTLLPRPLSKHGSHILNKSDQLASLEVLI